MNIKKLESNLEKSPFTTVFKATFGYYVAQAIAGLLGLCTLGIGVTILVVAARWYFR